MLRSSLQVIIDRMGLSQRDAFCAPSCCRRRVPWDLISPSRALDGHCWLLWGQAARGVRILPHCGFRPKRPEQRPETPYSLAAWPEGLRMGGGQQNDVFWHLFKRWAAAEHTRQRLGLRFKISLCLRFCLWRKVFSAETCLGFFFPITSRGGFIIFSYCCESHADVRLTADQREQGRFGSRRKTTPQKKTWWSPSNDLKTLKLYHCKQTKMTSSSGWNCLRFKKFPFIKALWRFGAKVPIKRLGFHGVKVNQWPPEYPCYLGFKVRCL